MFQAPMLRPLSIKPHGCTFRFSSAIISDRPISQRRMWSQPLRRLSRFSIRAQGSDEEDDAAEMRLRSEAEAPFRPVRLAIYYTMAVSSVAGFFINSSQMIGAIRDVPESQSILSVLQNLGIDGIFIVVLAYLIRSDTQAQEKLVARLTREKRLGNLQVRLSDDRFVRLKQLRGNCRVVIIAGNGEQIAEAMKPAEELREDLVKCATYIVQAPIFGSEGDLQFQTAGFQNLKWKGMAVGKTAWQKWFNDQIEEAGVAPERAVQEGLYVGLRMDGRVRSSGVGLPPPWFRYANELPPAEGLWKGFGDGFDGKV